MNFISKIHELRKKQGLSQEQLAEKVGVARQTISKWELGETAPDILQARMLSQIFNVSLDEMFDNNINESDNTKKDDKNNAPWRKIVTISVIVITVILVIFGTFTVVKRLQILYPEGIEVNITIDRRDPIIIEKGNAETIVFCEENKPIIACKLPEDFTCDADVSGLYSDKNGNFIKFNAEYSSDVVNPLFETDYYSYYENAGYHSYMDMCMAAMYNDSPKLCIFSSIEKLHLAGGAQIIRRQLCAGQNADYYAIDGGLTESGDAMRLYGFALHFENTTWLITLKDCNDVYYYIAIKDPDGIGKTINAVGEFLSTITVIE